MELVLFLIGLISLVVGGIVFMSFTKTSDRTVTDYHSREVQMVMSEMSKK